MPKTTKENILIVALHLFARDGYEAVSVSQIAGELGMTKGALYRHYESKRDIFEHIVKRMEQGDGEQAGEWVSFIPGSWYLAGTLVLAHHAEICYTVITT